MPKIETSRFNQILCYFCNALFAFVDGVVGPVYELFVNLRLGMNVEPKVTVKKCEPVREPLSNY
jgi:hypothetical protein